MSGAAADDPEPQPRELRAKFDSYTLFLRY